MIEQFSNMELLNQFWLILFFLIPMVLISRMVVAGTRFSPILIIVILGLGMGYLLVFTGVATPGLVEFPFVDLMARTTIIALTVSFFVGGQELRKILGNKDLAVEDTVVVSEEETFLGTSRTQFFYIVRAFFLLFGLEGITRLILSDGTGMFDNIYPLIAYIGIIGSILFIDNKAKISNKHQYMKKGLLEMIAIIILLVISYQIAMAVKPVIALPQIFFAMMIAAALGAIFYNWSFGPTIRALLVAGIPVVLAANFMIGDHV